MPGNKYIYVFSVPCFFMISGFLARKEDSLQMFWRKIWWNLVVPMCLMFLLNTVVQFAIQIFKGTFDVNFLWQAPLLALIGMQGQEFAAGGLKALWFVYSLIVCKIIFQFIPQKGEKITLLFVSVFCLFGAWILHIHGIVIRNAIVDVLLAMPFFAIGYLLRPYKNKLDGCSSPMSLLFLIVGIAGVWLCGTYNDIVMIYRCQFGSNLLLCLVGAICGTTAVFALSSLLKPYLASTVGVLGGGTLLILGLHFLIIQIIQQFLSISGMWLYVESFLILVSFLPVILFVKRFMPVLYGLYRVR